MKQEVNLRGYIINKYGEFIWGDIIAFEEDKEGRFNNYGFCDFKPDIFKKVVKNVPMNLITLEYTGEEL